MQVGLLIQRSLPLGAQGVMPAHLSVADQSHCFFRPEYDVGTVVGHELVQIVAVPTDLPRDFSSIID